MARFAFDIDANDLILFAIVAASCPIAAITPVAASVAFSACVAAPKRSPADAELTAPEIASYITLEDPLKTP